MKLLSILLMSLFLASCASTNVSLPTRSAYAPKDYRPKGMVKYLNQGADFAIANRKEDAFKQMSDNCNGNYKITAEGPREEGGVITKISPDSAMMMSSEYWYISYECLN